jgi:hypothetical protein
MAFKYSLANCEKMEKLIAEQKRTIESLVAQLGELKEREDALCLCYEALDDKAVPNNWCVACGPDTECGAA